MHISAIYTKNQFQQCFLGNVKRMKKKQNNCKCYQAIKRCVFRVRSTEKQEMLQSKALPPGYKPQMSLNSGLERPCPFNLRDYLRTFNATEPSFSPQAHENHTVH